MKFYAVVIQPAVLSPRLLYGRTREELDKVLAGAKRTYFELKLACKIGPVVELEVPLAED